MRTDKKGASYSIGDNYKLEVDDPKHRPAVFLKPFYRKWQQAQTPVPFFTWVEQLPPSSPDYKTVHSMVMIRYLSEKEKDRYEIQVAKGIFVSKTGQPISTKEYCTADCGMGWANFTAIGNLLWIVSENHDAKTNTTLAHSSHHAAGPVDMAGEILITTDGLVIITDRSGHYKIPISGIKLFLKRLQEQGINLNKTVVLITNPSNSKEFSWYLASDFQMNSSPQALNPDAVASMTPEWANKHSIYRNVSLKIANRNNHEQKKVVDILQEAFGHQTSDLYVDDFERGYSPSRKFLVQMDDKYLLLRTIHPSSTTFALDNELPVTLMASDAKIGAPVVHSDPLRQAIIFTYLDAEVIKPLQNLNLVTLQRMVSKLRTLHHLTPTVKLNQKRNAQVPEVKLSVQIAADKKPHLHSIKRLSLIDLITKNLASMPSSLQNKFNLIYAWLIEAHHVLATPDEIGICHNDLQPENILRTRDQEIYLIDYEYSGIGIKSLDLGIVADLCLLDHRAIYHLLKEYYGYEPTAIEMTKLYLAMTASKIFNMAWAFAQCPQPIDSKDFFLAQNQKPLSYSNILRNVYLGQLRLDTQPGLVVFAMGCLNAAIQTIQSENNQFALEYLRFRQIRMTINKLYDEHHLFQLQMSQFYLPDNDSKKNQDDHCVHHNP